MPPPNAPLPENCTISDQTRPNPVVLAPPNGDSEFYEKFPKLGTNEVSENFFYFVWSPIIFLFFFLFYYFINIQFRKI